MYKKLKIYILREPTQYEKDHWAQLNPESSNLPLIAKWRFPFLPNIDQWKLISKFLYI